MLLHNPFDSLLFGFLLLCWTSFLLDYPLQCEFLKKYKNQSALVMSIHCFMWSFGLYLMLAVLWNKEALWKLLFLFIGHFIIDTWKAKRLYRTWKFKKLTDHVAYAVDQGLHILQIFIVFFI